MLRVSGSAVVALNSTPAVPPTDASARVAAPLGPLATAVAAAFDTPPTSVSVESASWAYPFPAVTRRRRLAGGGGSSSGSGGPPVNATLFYSLLLTFPADVTVAGAAWATPAALASQAYAVVGAPSFAASNAALIAALYASLGLPAPASAAFFALSPLTLVTGPLPVSATQSQSASVGSGSLGRAQASSTSSSGSESWGERGIG